MYAKVLRFEYKDEKACVLSYKPTVRSKKISNATIINRLFEKINILNKLCLSLAKNDKMEVNTIIYNSVSKIAFKCISVLTTENENISA